MSTDGETRMFVVKIPARLHVELKTVLASKQKTMRTWLLDTINRYLKEEGAWTNRK